MKRVVLRSLAKINVDLRVLNKRPDGFHELRTVFQTISLADTIAIEVGPGPTRIEIDSDIPNNLIVRAADSVLEKTGRTASLRFGLKKRIPMGGGLAGGSSDAAAVLLALPALLGAKLSLEERMDIASELGSDVPFFLLGGTAAGAGRGTELYPLPDVSNYPLVLVTPGVHVSTPAAYAALGRELTSLPLSSTMNSFQAFVWRFGSYLPGQEWGSSNDFERVVFEQHPRLKEIKKALESLGARPALMSGSGSALFGVFSSREHRDRAVASIQGEFENAKVHAVSMVSRRRYRALWWRQLAGIAEPGTWPPQDQSVA